jgi:tRNA(Arg) A34 adenosine deaminase TadA
MASRAVAEAAPRAAEPGRANRAAPIRPTSSAVVDVTSSIFAPSATVMDEIEASGSKGLDVRVIAKGLTEEGHIKVRKDRLNKFHSVGTGSMPILNPWTQQLGGMHLNFAIDDSAIQDGYASLAPKGGGKNKWLQALQNNATLLGGLGLKIESLPKPVNRFENGKLELGVTGARIVVGGYVDADFDLLLENMNKPKIKGSAKIVISGTTPQELALESDGDKLTGSVSLAVTYKSFSGAVKVVYLADGTVDVAGKAAYSADKLSGEIAFVATDLDAANKFARDAIAAAGGKENVQNAAAPAPVPVAKQGQKKRALAATGQLGFNLTKWFAGTVNVVVDGKGAITVIGKIAPPGEIILFKEKPWDKEIVKFEAKAYYGLPVVGNLNLFANISLHAIARLGPATLSKIEILGTYSTDPEIQKSIQISGSINISAYAGLRLRAEGGAGITIVKHDLKFGIGLNADVGVKAYADARPTIGYRDPGDFYISGTLDLVAQPMLGLSGEFFIELDAPWFSPIDDDRWSWPLFSKEWPLSDPIGISATLKDYVLGSGNVPEITIKPPEFDPSKFMSNMVDDKLPNKSGAAGSGQGTFKEDGSVPKPIVPPKKPVPKTAPAKPGKKGPKLATSKSGTADPKGPKERANTKTLENAAEKVVALKGKGPLTEAALDAELAKIRAAVSGVSFDKKLNSTKWSVKPKAGGKAAKTGIEIGAAGKEGPVGRKNEPASVGTLTPDGVRAKAKKMILTQLRGDLRPKDLVASLHEISSVLRPQGLKSLELSQPDDNGVFRILAEASPKLPLLQAVQPGLIPKGTTVRMVARVKTENPSDDKPKAIEQLPATEAGATYRRSKLLNAPSGPLGGAVVRVGGSQSDVVTWNTSSDRKLGNVSHAEHQFINYMEKRQQRERDFYSRVSDVLININLSPCTVCVDELSHLVNEIKRARGGRKLDFTIVWSKLYATRPQATTAQGLNKLGEIGIKLSAPSDARPTERPITVHIEPLK